MRRAFSEKVTEHMKLQLLVSEQSNKLLALKKEMTEKDSTIAELRAVIRLISNGGDVSNYTSENPSLRFV
jgi:hypothetical protein